MNRTVSTPLILMTVAASAHAQGQVPLVPFEHTGDLYVTDSTSDNVVRLIDLNLDGDFDDANEVTTFYDDALGPFALGNNVALAFALDGALFVCDTTEDRIFRMIDLDGDGDANDAGETTVFFDGDPSINLSSLEMVSPNGITVDGTGQVWIAEANNGSGGIDSIVLLRDLDLDGDANDAGEASRYYAPVGVPSTGDSIPNDVFVGQDGHVYYLEGGSTGVVAKAVYRMDDANSDGVIDPLTEIATFFDPPAQPATPFLWSLTQGVDGTWYAADTGNELIWRFRDDDGDGVIDPALEASIWWVASGSSNVWELAVDSKGGVYAAESQSPDRVLYLFDGDGDGVISASEQTEVWSETLSPIDVANPRGLALERLPTLNAPAAVSIGGPFAATVFATEADLVQTLWSLNALAPFPVAPFGYLVINPGPGSGTLYTGGAGGDGVHAAVLTVPSQPGLVGVTLYTQCFAGKTDRFQLGTGGVTLIQ